MQAERMKPQEQVTLEPYERDHAVVVDSLRKLFNLKYVRESVYNILSFNFIDFGVLNIQPRLEIPPCCNKSITKTIRL